MTKQVPTRIANILINALKGGVVPRAGLEYITVGRTQEIAAILHDIEMIEEGGASFRFIVGKYGSGSATMPQPKALPWWTRTFRRSGDLPGPRDRGWLLIRS